MSAFKAIVGLIEENYPMGGGNMIDESFKYTSNLPLKMGNYDTLMPFGDVPPMKMGEDGPP
jgi:hypothetical protein